MKERELQLFFITPSSVQEKYADPNTYLFSKMKYVLRFIVNSFAYHKTKVLDGTSGTVRSVR